MVRGEAGLWGAPAPSGSAGQMNSRFCEGAAHFLSKAHVISPEQTLAFPAPSLPRLEAQSLPLAGCHTPSYRLMGSEGRCQGTACFGGKAPGHGGKRPRRTSARPQQCPQSTKRPAGLR